MKKYELNSLLEKSPTKATHVNFSIYSYTYIWQSDDFHRFWLGFKFGGWSIKIAGQYRNLDKCVLIKN